MGSGRTAAGMLAAARDAFLPGRGLFQLTHFVTVACDARCDHCFYRKSRAGRELSVEEIASVARSIGRLRFLLISGGEPFLRKDLPEIVEAYRRETSFVNVSIPTNGLETRAILDAMGRICAISPDLSFSLSVSIDGFREFHDSLRGVRGIFDAACRTLAGAKRLQAEHPRLFIGVISTLMGSNMDELDRLIEFVHKEFSPDSHTINLWRGTGPAGRPPGVGPDDYLRLNRKISSLYSGSGARSIKRRMRDAANELRYRYIARVWREGRFIRPCRAGERELVLAEDGEVFPCELMLGRSLGNVRDAGYDLMSILRGVKARAFLGWSRENRCFCTHECNARTMLLLSPSTLARILWLAAARLPRRYM